jgi:hypothetical protein
MSTESFESLVNQLNQFFFDFLKNWESSHLEDPAYRSRHDTLRSALQEFSLHASYLKFKGLEADSCPTLTDSLRFLSIMACAKSISDEISSPAGLSRFNQQCWLPTLTLGYLAYGPGVLGQDLYTQVYDKMISLLSGHEVFSKKLSSMIDLVTKTIDKLLPLAEVNGLLQAIILEKPVEDSLGLVSFGFEGDEGGGEGAASLVRKASLKDPLPSKAPHLLTLAGVFYPEAELRDAGLRDAGLKGGLAAISEEDRERDDCEESASPEELSTHHPAGLGSRVASLSLNASQPKGKPQAVGVQYVVLGLDGNQISMTEKAYKKLCKKPGPQPRLVAKITPGTRGSFSKGGEAIEP